MNQNNPTNLPYPEYCGYCKCSPCQCDGHGGPVGNHGICGYCHDYIMDDGCSCDGFGGDQEVVREVIAESEQEAWVLAARREGFHPDLDYGIYDIRLKGPYPQASQWYEDEVVEVGNDK